MSDDSALDDILASWAAPLAIVTGSDGEQRAGCVVGFHGQCGIEPLRYAVWLSKANSTYRVATFASHLAVHVVDQDDEELARHFGGASGDDVDKFAGIDVEEGPGGAPLLAALPTRFVGRRSAALDVGGDHVCFVLDIVDTASGGRRDPLRTPDLVDLDPGHEADERPTPYDERA